jgi:hypothetical protein
MMAMDTPRRLQAEKERQKLIKKDEKGSRTDTPAVLPLAKLKTVEALFQPRFDSIAYAPGRSEGHVAILSAAAKGNADLDPLMVVAFGQDWYLVDGHHRVEAYRQAGRTDPVPIKVLPSELRGAERVSWAHEASFSDNKKNRLNLSGADKADGAWRAVAAGELGSKSETALKYGVGPSTIANMRQTKKALEGLEADFTNLQSWSAAKRELAWLGGSDGAERSNFQERQKMLLARNLKRAMQMNPAPGMLAAALEAYSPGIVNAMNLAPIDDDGGPDLDD